ncbi:two-component sensor histidine kinase [Ignatzschineria indica]|nr:two-component sensor histidine kinase [Ignatzschineria indica]
MKNLQQWWQQRRKGQKRLYSLRATLMASIVASTLLVSGVSLSITTYLSWDQTKEVLDEALKRSAQTLAQLAYRENLGGRPVKGHMDLEDNEFYFQIINQGVVIAKSSSAPNRPFIATSDRRGYKGFNTIKIKGKDWRVFLLKPRHANFEVQVAHAVEMRYQFLEKLAKQLILAGGIVLLISLLINGLFIYFGLRPLTVVSQQIKRISSKSLTPIATHSRSKEIVAIEDSLNMLLTNLETARRHERQFTADASHELRTPLSAIQMKLQLLRRLRPELIADLAPLQHDISRATHLIEHLMLLARLDPLSPDENSDLLKQELLFSVLFSDLNESFKEEATRRGIEIHFHEERVSLCANYDLLYIALKNLINNALKYSPRGSKIEVTSGTIFVNAAKEVSERAIIKVRDNGRGVEPEELARLGQRFYRVLGTDEIGSGLGLSIVKKIVELHRGEMHLRSKPELDGLEVSLIFPVEKR